jgi:cytochrome P450
VSSGERPPGPRGSPLLGSTLEMRRDPLGAYTRFAREHGDVVLVRFLLWPLYLLFHPDHVRRVLQEKHSAYGKDLYTYRLLKPVVGNGLVTNDGPGWLRQRRLVQPAFHRSRLPDLAAIAVEACARLVERWDAVAGSGRVVDVADEMQRLALQVAGRSLFRSDLSSEASEAGAAFATVNELLTDYVHSPLPPLAVPSRRNLRLRAATRVLDRLVGRIVGQRRAQAAEGGDVLSALLLARDEETGRGMDDRQLRDEVVTLLFAGHETTASALAWTFFLLARHPREEARVREEAVAVMGGAYPSLDDLERMPLAGRALDEAMRLYPPAWSFGRRALRDDEIGGFRIPAGSLVWVSPYVTHRHPDFWERPEEFEPDRFSPERSAARPRFAYFPFGSGPRMCVGAHFATTVARLALASVLPRFRLRLAEGFEPEPQALLTLRSRNGMRMTVERA